jgi:hypothetical protein
MNKSILEAAKEILIGKSNLKEAKGFPKKKRGMMRVYAEYHKSAALLTELETGKEKTMLVQPESDQDQMLGKNWDEGIYQISDEYMEYFE